MQIAVVIDSFLPKHVGGLEIATYNLLKELNHHEIHVITSLDDNLPYLSMINNICVHRIPRNRQKFLKIILLPFFLIKIFCEIKKINPDLVHFQSLYAGLSGLLIKKIFNIPYLVWGRGSEVYLSYPIYNNFFYKYISRIVLDNADVVIALTRDMKRKMNEMTKNEIHVIPNGINLNNFKIETGKLIIRDKLNIEASDRIIIFIGRLDKIKGVEYLIYSMKILLNRGYDYKLLIVGDGLQRTELEQLTIKLNLENNITFYGMIQNEELPKYLKASDILVLPSLSEGFPSVLLEGMAVGLPIIATKITGVDEIIEDGVNGFLIKPKDPYDIARKVVKLNNIDLAKKMSRNNQNKINKYRWDVIALKVEKLYEEIIHNKNEDSSI